MMMEKIFFEQICPSVGTEPGWLDYILHSEYTWF